jgi:5-formyltetrahydrofolate cyclo-ligase
MDLKPILRKEVRERLRLISPSHRATSSAKACALLEQQPAWKNAQDILFFAPLPSELNIWPLVCDSLSENKLVALPRFNPVTSQYIACQIRNISTDLKTGRFDIREPADHCPIIPLNRLDLILVPGVAFDPRGRRLGRGKGFYDQLLPKVRGTACGVAFDEQIVDEIPVEPHDVHLNCILTPTRWIEP